MKFEDWFNQQVNFHLLSEEFCTDLDMYASMQNVTWRQHMIEWMKTAFNEGMKHGFDLGCDVAKDRMYEV